MTTRAQEPFASFGNCTEKTYGFASVNGKDHNIPPTYCEATGFSEGLASVKLDGQWGYIDVNQKTRIPFSFDYAARFKHGQAIVQQGKFRGVIDKQGDYVVSPIYLDLQMLEIDGKPYYMSRDSTFFAGLIDSQGDEVIPHRYTYLLPLTGYQHLPFYTVFREIDTAQGSFYEQFEDNPFLFSPEQGRHDLYDSQFNKLASKQSSDYSDGFPQDKLQQIDAFLQETPDKPAEDKVKAVERILSSPASTPAPAPVSIYGEYAPRESSEIDGYLEELGYRFFTENGKTGLKKGNEILIPAEHRQLRFVNGVILFPQPADMPMLEKDYGGVYRNKEKGIFDIFAVLSADDEPTEGTVQYSLSGVISLPIAETIDGGKKLISTINSLGFLYLYTTQDTAGLTEKRYSLVSWKGEELLPPVYDKIEVTKAGHVLVSQEKEVPEGIEEHVGLFSPTGEEIVPVGVYSSIKAFFEGDRALYLVTWSDPYPTMEEWKENNDTNKTYVILEVDGSGSRVVNTFTASTVHMAQLDAETGMLQYIKRVSGASKNVK
ncbi:MAG TPA: WG repeat-containing protein [Sphingobacterium sp.]|nr:WG repeat-containing protein [Sphingobacterium sp.]